MHSIGKLHYLWIFSTVVVVCIYVSIAHMRGAGN